MANYDSEMGLMDALYEGSYTAALFITIRWIISLAIVYFVAFVFFSAIWTAFSALFAFLGYFIRIVTCGWCCGRKREREKEN
jgi:hypothetical protein